MADPTKVKDDPRNFPWLGRKLLFLDDMRNVTRIVYGLYAVCALLFLADFLYKKKTYLAAENFPGFYALYGFFMCAGLVIGAKAMRLFLKRDETYYTPNDVESEAYPEDGLSRESIDD